MKKFGRKRPAASAIGETKFDSSQGEGKKGTKHNVKTMDAAGQPLIFVDHGHWTRTIGGCPPPTHTHPVGLFVGAASQYFTSKAKEICE